MRFEKGHWQLLPGVQAIYPISIVDVQADSDALVITGYDHTIRQRGDFLGGTTISARFTSPLTNVIRVELTHFKGQRQRLPAFDLDYSLRNEKAEIGLDTKRAWLNCGDLSVVIARDGKWGYEFQRGGKPLVGSFEKSTALMSKDGFNYMREGLSLSPGEMVYGLGERFGPFIKNGQSIDIWNEDGGTDSEYAYKNIPFYITGQGYGVLVNNPGLVSFEVASHHATNVQFSVSGHSLDYYIFGGPSMKDVLEQLTALSGRPAILPDWSFGLWLSTSFTTNYDEETILSNLDRMEREGIPVSVFHFDCFWMKELNWCNFLWDRRYFPDPAAMLQRIKERGVRICLWINPYIAEASPLFSEGTENGFLLKTLQGDVYQVDDWQPGLAFVDFTNPQARAWYSSKLRTLLEMGVDAFKTDFGERIPTQVRYFDGSDPERMHNYYTYLYNQTVFELLREMKGEGNAVLFARSATCGSQKYPLHWGGDNSSTYPSMVETLRGGLSLGMCGFGYWSHDISGFNDTATPDLYKRWVAFGLLSSHSRLHGNNSSRTPWNFDDEAVAVLRHFSTLKAKLMPYLRHLAEEAHQYGWPMMRSMVFEFPFDRTCLTLDMQYMLGSALLVAPVLNSQGKVDYYMPQGEWRHLLTYEVCHGPVWSKDTCDYFSLPIWVNVERGKAWDCLG
jgi:alpha-D-xyloside xylohydrolase